MAISKLHTRLDRLEGDRGQVQSVFHSRYAKDPVGYVHDVLGVQHLSSDQEEFLRLLTAPPPVRILVSSANETGKSFMGACAGNWHYDCYRPSLTFATAPSQSQVNDILFREVRKLRGRDPNFYPRAATLQDADDHLFKGFTAKSGTSFHGRHDASVMLIFDEAEGIDHEFWEAAESFADIWICFYNPTEAGSQAAVEETRKTWKRITMSALNHPNVVRGEKGLPPLIPNAVTLQKVIHRLEKWAVKVDMDAPPDPRDVVVAGVRYRPGPIAEARILGRRPSKPINAVFLRSDLDRMEKEIRHEIKDHWPVQIGVDVARFGDDNSVIIARKGLCAVHHEAHNGWDGHRLAARIKEVARELVGEHPAPEVPILVDDIGAGSSVMDSAGGFNFIGINASSKATEPLEYPNMRSQLMFDMEEMVREGLIDLSRLGEQARYDIVEQMRAAAFEMGTGGRRVVIPKKIMKANLGRSPDDLDALLLCYYQFPETLESYSKRPRS